MIMLSLADVADYLVQRGVTNDVELAVTQLTGGVSGHCFLVESATERWVVKQALEELAVDGKWTASPARSSTETAALTLLHSITPNSTPRLVDADTSNFTFTMSAAPAGYRSWKDSLLSDSDSHERVTITAGFLGEVLAAWHNATWRNPVIASQFNDYDALEQLRVKPFHRAIAMKHPQVEEPVGACIEDLLEQRECLVHGDYSPKNVLVGPGDPWVIDFEVAHVGAAVFDVAFLECHLLLKALHQPERAAVYRDAASGFLDAYLTGMHTEPEIGRLPWHTACLLLARVDGVSPAGYLRPIERSRARELALSALSRPAPSLAELWNLAIGVPE